MQVICLQDDAFYALIDELVLRVKEMLKAPKEDKWLSTEEAMARLHIKSKATLQKLRDEGLIRFSHPVPKLIVYDRDSIDEYLSKHAKNPF